MKSFILAGACLTLAIASCKKSNDSAPNPGSGSTLVRIQQGTDPDITNDTVYLIKYDASSRIASITDSLNQDTLVAAYDGVTGKLATVKSTWGDNASFVYDGSGQLLQVNYILAGSSERDAFEYSNGVVSKKSYYSNLGSGSLSLQGYSTYVVTNGNITSMSDYTKGGTLKSTTTYAYNTQTNSFKDLSLFNNGNALGTDNIINRETYFNKNLLASASLSGAISSNTYSFNGSTMTKAIALDASNGEVYTWMFSYK